MILLLYKAKKKQPNRLLTSFHQTQQRHRQRAEISRLKSLKCATAITARVRTNKPLQNTDTETALWEREREQKTSSTGHTNECFGRREAQISEKNTTQWGDGLQQQEMKLRERKKWRERERARHARECATVLPRLPSLSLSLSLLARLSSLPLTGLFAVDGDGRWRSRCRSLPGDYNCSLDGWIDGTIIYYD
jgi:hypothetical protein